MKKPAKGEARQAIEVAAKAITKKRKATNEFKTR